MDGGDGRHIRCLALMARNAVQEQNITSTKARTVEEEGNDLFGEAEALVLEKQTVFQNAEEKVLFRLRVRIGADARNNGTKLGAEVKMMGPSAEKTAGGEEIAERTFSGSGWTEQ
jgi:hypothetical protein